MYGFVDIALYGRSKWFFENTNYGILAIHTKRRRCRQVGPTPCYSQSQVCVHTKFQDCSAMSFSGNITIFWTIFNTERGVTIYSILKTFPWWHWFQIRIYWFVGLTKSLLHWQCRPILGMFFTLRLLNKGVTQVYGKWYPENNWLQVNYEVNLCKNSSQMFLLNICLIINNS